MWRLHARATTIARGAAALGAIQKHPPQLSALGKPRSVERRERTTHFRLPATISRPTLPLRSLPTIPCDHGHNEDQHQQHKAPDMGSRAPLQALDGILLATQTLPQPLA